MPPCTCVLAVHAELNLHCRLRGLARLLPCPVRLLGCDGVPGSCSQSIFSSIAAPAHRCYTCRIHGAHRRLRRQWLKQSRVHAQRPPPPPWELPAVAAEQLPLTGIALPCRAVHSHVRAPQPSCWQLLQGSADSCMPTLPCCHPGAGARLFHVHTARAAGAATTRGLPCMWQCGSAVGSKPNDGVRAEKKPRGAGSKGGQDVRGEEQKSAREMGQLGEEQGKEQGQVGRGTGDVELRWQPVGGAPAPSPGACRRAALCAGLRMLCCACVLCMLCCFTPGAWSPAPGWPRTAA